VLLALLALLALPALPALLALLLLLLLQRQANKFFTCDIYSKEGRSFLGLLSFFPNHFPASENNMSKHSIR
jgi:hypothetical protein